LKPAKPRRNLSVGFDVGDGNAKVNFENCDVVEGLLEGTATVLPVTRNELGGSLAEEVEDV
jgi:hypothetical protein